MINFTTDFLKVAALKADIDGRHLTPGLKALLDEMLAGKTKGLTDPKASVHVMSASEFGRHRDRERHGEARVITGPMRSVIAIESIVLSRHERHRRVSNARLCSVDIDLRWSYAFKDPAMR